MIPHIANSITPIHLGQKQEYNYPKTYLFIPFILNTQQISSTATKTINTNVSIFIPFQTWSEWEDSNLQPHAPKARALPDCATLRYYLYYLLFSTVVLKTIRSLSKTIMFL